MRRATVHVDLANKSCHVTSRRRFHGSWGPDITRSTVEGVIAVDGWRFAPNSAWAMTIDGGTHKVERPGPIRRLIERLAEQYRERRAIRATDRLLDDLGSANPTADTDDELTARLLARRNATEADPIPDLVDTDTAIATIKGEAA
jgi:hypothetical protein